MKWIWLAIGIFAPTSLWADIVLVRSGEHQDYTRLVLYIEAGTEWEAAPSNTGYIITLGDPAQGFDTSEVFSRIPRSRIGDITQNGPVMNVVSDCLCHLDAFLYTPTMVVLDIRDGPQPAAELDETPRADDLLSAARQPVFQDLPSPYLEEQNTIRTVNLPLFTPKDDIPQHLTLLTNPLAVESPENPNLGEAERAILESFARAATQGVFDFPARPLPPPPGEGQQPFPNAISPVTDPMDGIPIAFDAAMPDAPGFLLQTGIDRSAMEGDAEEIDAHCPAETRLDIDGWGQAGGFGTLIPILRLSVTNEAGRTDDADVMTLARAYIYYGFGQEARRSLSLMSRKGPDVELLNLLARLVDETPVSPIDTLPFRSCDPAMEFWFTLAGGALDPDDHAQVSAVLVAYRALPDTLRGHLGIRLAKILADIGLVQTAEEILGDAVDAITGDSRQAELAWADIQGRTYGAGVEAAHLNAFVGSNPRAEPDDMARLMDLAREEKMDLDQEVFEIAETMRFEADGGRPQATLLEAEVRLLIEQNRSLQALQLLGESPDALPDTLRADLRSLSIVNLSQTATDGDFLAFAFSEPPGTIGGAALNAIAQRMLDLGFPHEVLALLADPADGTDQVERQRLRRLANAMIQSHAAALDPGKPTQTSDRLTDAAPVQDDVESAWRQGRWEDLQQSDDQLLSRASRALSAPAPLVGQNTPLADTSSLIEDAGMARDLAQELLNRFEIQP